MMQGIIKITMKFCLFVRTIPIINMRRSMMKSSNNTSDEYDEKYDEIYDEVFSLCEYNWYNDSLYYC